MNRPIKFRAWLTEEREMIPWFPQMFADYSPVTGYGDEFPQDENRVVLLQFTGLLDMDGVEIYEGDLVRFCDMGGSVDVVGYYPPCFKGIEFSLHDHEIKVIGNIYEPPDGD